MARKKSKKKKRIARITVLVALLLLAAGLIFLNSRFFAVKTLEVRGNSAVSEEEILAGLELREGTNLVRYMLRNLLHKPECDPRLQDCQVYVYWPDKVVVEVREQSFIGYIYYQGSYLCLNREGVVIASAAEREYEIPLIRGVEVGSFELGRQPVTDDAACFREVLTVATVLHKYGLTGEFAEINVRDPKNVILYSEKLEVRLGVPEDADLKIRTLRAFTETYPELRGVLHLEDMDGQIHLEPFQ